MTLFTHSFHRTAGELKRLHFNWVDVISVEEGREELSHSLPARFKIQPGDDRANCFVSISTKLKGNFQMVFKSELMRNACLKGFSLLIAKRKSAGDESIEGAKSTSSSEKSIFAAA